MEEVSVRPPASHRLAFFMDEEQQIIQEPVQEPAPEKQPDKTQATLTAVSPLVSVFFGFSTGVNIIPPLICWLVWKDANPLVDKVGKNECPDFLGDLFDCGLPVMFCPDRLRAGSRGRHRVDCFRHYHCRQGGERGLRLRGAPHDYVPEVTFFPLAHL